MLDGSASGCLNHPGVEAAFRCKQCMKPVCRSCAVTGPRGNFCSDACKEKFEAFAQRAETLDAKRGGGFAKLRRVFVKLILFAAVLLGAGWLCITLEIPVLSDLVWQIRDRLGI